MASSGVPFLLNFKLVYTVRKSLKFLITGVGVSNTYIPIHHLSISNQMVCSFKTCIPIAITITKLVQPTFSLLLGKLHGIWRCKLCVNRHQSLFQRWMQFKCKWVQTNWDNIIAKCKRNINDRNELQLMWSLLFYLVCLCREIGTKYNCSQTGR